MTAHLPAPQRRLERPPHTLNRHHEVTEHETRLEPEHAVAKPPKHRVPPRVSTEPACVMGAVDLDDQPAASADEATYPSGQGRRSLGRGVE